MFPRGKNAGSFALQMLQRTSLEAFAARKSLHSFFFSGHFAGHFAGISPARFSPTKSHAKETEQTRRTQEGILADMYIYICM